MNILIPINNNTNHADISQHLSDPAKTYFIFLPNRLTKVQDYDSIRQLITQLKISPDHLIEINTSSIIQKTWRIIKHYTEIVATTENDQINKDSEEYKSLQLIRIQNIRQHIETLIINDQALKLNAKILKI